MNNCIPTIRSCGIVVEKNNVTINLPDIQLINGKHYNLVICQCIPNPCPVGDVTFKVCGNTIPGMDAIGNALKTDMLCSRTRYDMVYGWDTPHLLVRTCKQSAFVPTPSNQPASVMPNQQDNKEKTFAKAKEA